MYALRGMSSIKSCDPYLGLRDDLNQDASVKKKITSIAVSKTITSRAYAAKSFTELLEDVKQNCNFMFLCDSVKKTAILEFYIVH